MSFFRHREIFRSDVIPVVRERRNRRSRPHRLDEFPIGYSSADCSPAGSASASPTVDHSALKSSCRSIPFHRTVNSVLTVCLSLGDHPIFNLARLAITQQFSRISFVFHDLTLICVTIEYFPVSVDCARALKPVQTVNALCISRPPPQVGYEGESANPTLA